MMIISLNFTPNFSNSYLLIHSPTGHERHLASHSLWPGRRSRVHHRPKVHRAGVCRSPRVLHPRLWHGGGQGDQPAGRRAHDQERDALPRLGPTRPTAAVPQPVL